MVRTQIQLHEDQASALKRLATERGTSMATLIREAVDELLARPGGREERIRRALAAVGTFRSGTRDISVDHDKYLAEAYKK